VRLWDSRLESCFIRPENGTPGSGGARRARASTRVTNDGNSTEIQSPQRSMEVYSYTKFQALVSRDAIPMSGLVKLSISTIALIPTPVSKFPCRTFQNLVAMCFFLTLASCAHFHNPRNGRIYTDSHMHVGIQPGATGGGAGFTLQITTDALP
jgi:hypothetical protein